MKRQSQWLEREEARPHSTDGAWIAMHYRDPKNSKFQSEFPIYYEGIFVKVGRQNVLFFTVNLISNFKIFKPIVCLPPL